MTNAVAEPVDYVNHPPHYNNHPSGVECIQITEHMGFNLGNVVKYVWRADLKGEALEDLSKARFYLDRELKRREYLDQQMSTEPINFQSIFDEVMGWGLAGDPVEDNKDLAFWVNEDEDGDLELVIPLGDEDDLAPGDPVGVAAADIPEGSQVSLVYDDDTDAVTFHPVLGETVAPTVETTVTDIYLDLLATDLDPRLVDRVNAIAETDEFRNFSQWVADKLTELHADELFQDAQLNQRQFPQPF